MGNTGYRSYTTETGWIPNSSRPQTPNPKIIHAKHARTEKHANRGCGGVGEGGKKDSVWGLTAMPPSTKRSMACTLAWAPRSAPLAATFLLALLGGGSPVPGSLEAGGAGGSGTSLVSGRFMAPVLRSLFRTSSSKYLQSEGTRRVCAHARFWAGDEKQAGS